MTRSFKAIVLVFGIGLGSAAVAQPIQQPAYQGPMRPMNPGMGQAGPMMTSPEMRASVAQMRESCDRMMSTMRDRMQQSPSNRR